MRQLVEARLMRQLVEARLMRQLVEARLTRLQAVSLRLLRPPPV